MSDNILKVHYLIKRLKLGLIKTNKNYCSYYLKSLAVDIFLTELSTQTFAEFLINLDCLSEYMHVDLRFERPPGVSQCLRKEK